MSCVKCLKKTNNVFKENWLSIAMILAIVLGVALGILLKTTTKLSQHQILYLGFLGDMFLQAIQGVCIPLMVGCLVVSFATLETKLLKFYGLRLVLYVIITKLIGLTIGLTVGLVFKPGVRNASKSKLEKPLDLKPITKVVSEPIDNFLDMFYNLFPSNIFSTNFKISVTNTTKDFEGNKKFENVLFDGVNMLGLVTFSVAIGIGLKVMGESSRSLLNLTVVFTEICKFIVILLMFISPIMLLSLVAGQMLKIDLQVFATSVGKYTACAVGALSTMAFIVFPIIILIMTHRNPYMLYFRYLKVITTGFACSSSLASLPIAISVLAKEMHYNETLVNFVVPILLAMNKDAGPILLPNAVIFFAQYEDIDLEWHAYLILCIFSLTLTVAAPAVPQALIVVIILVLDSLNIPKGNIGSILAVDVLVDRVGTIVHMTACLTAVEMLSKRTLAGSSRSSIKSSSVQEIDD